MEIFQLVYIDVNWISEERDKYIWEDLYSRSWDEIIGRMYLLKANQNAGCMYPNERVEDDRYQDALADFEQALLLLAEDDVRGSYYVRALADKALTQCFLGQYDAALTTLDQALTVTDKSDKYYHDIMLNNRAAMPVLTGAYSEALDTLHAQLERHPKDSDLRSTLATCLLHMERYPEAVAAYEQVIAQEGRLENNAGLIAARLLQAKRKRQQKDQ